ncbi:carnitine transporter [Rhizophlyctis rosea]|nr:carnitine transporter [Rhizophlyctis rosea]
MSKWVRPQYFLTFILDDREWTHSGIQRETYHYLMATSETNPPRQPQPPVEKYAALRSFISGGSGGLCMVICSHPLDLVKVRMQTATANHAAYTSTLSAAKKILLKDGFRGLYRGVTPVLVGTPPVLATCMWAYHQGQVLVSSLMGGPGRKPSETPQNLSPHLVNKLSYLQVGLAGAFSALPTSFILGPAEQVKIRLQIQDSSMKSQRVRNASKTAADNGFRNVVMGIVREGGVRALFRGTGLTLLRDVPGSFFYFLVYEAVKRSFGGDKADGMHAGAVLLAGGLAGVANWTVCIPIDTVKSRYQSGRTPHGTSALRTIFRDIWAEAGVKGFFRGLGPTLLRAFPASAAFFFGVETSTKFMDKILQ